METQLLILSLAGFSITALAFVVDYRNRQRAFRAHATARLRGYAANGLARAEIMVRRSGLTSDQIRTVLSYLAQLERLYLMLGEPQTVRIDRLRQKLTLKNQRVSVVV